MIKIEVTGNGVGCIADRRRQFSGVVVGGEDRYSGRRGRYLPFLRLADVREPEHEVDEHEDCALSQFRTPRELEALKSFATASRAAVAEFKAMAAA